MTGWLPEIMVLKDRFERFTTHSSGFAGGHWIEDRITHLGDRAWLDKICSHAQYMIGLIIWWPFTDVCLLVQGWSWDCLPWISAIGLPDIYAQKKIIEIVKFIPSSVDPIEHCFSWCLSNFMTINRVDALRIGSSLSSSAGSSNKNRWEGIWWDVQASYHLF